MNLNLLSQLASQAFGLDLEVVSVQPCVTFVKVAFQKGNLVWYPETNQYDAALPKPCLTDGMRRSKNGRLYRYQYQCDITHEDGELDGNRAALRLRTLLHELWADRNFAAKQEEIGISSSLRTTHKNQHWATSQARWND